MAKIGDLGIDLGTSNVLVYMKGKGIVLREPAVVAIERQTKHVLAVGRDAYQMIGRTPGNVLAVRPLRDGSSSDLELTNTMLRYFLYAVMGKRYLSHPRVVMSVPAGVNDSDKRSLLRTMLSSGVKHTYLLEPAMAAAIGIGMKFHEPYGRMIVNMSAGRTDISVLAMGKEVISEHVSIGGDSFDDAIIRYLRRKHNLLIGERTAEEIKINIGCAVPQLTEVTMEAVGRNLLSGLPRVQEITNTEMYEALKDPIADLIDAMKYVIEKTPPQLASDIFDDGIVLTGGAAALTGLSEAVYMALRIPCGVANDPQTSVVMGCGKAVEDVGSLEYLMTDARHLRPGGTQER